MKTNRKAGIEGVKPWKKPHARPGKEKVQRCAQMIAREFRRRADALEAACSAPDPLAAAVNGIGMGRVISRIMFLTSSMSRRDMLRQRKERDAHRRIS